MNDRDDLAALINGGPLIENPGTVGGIYAIHTAYERADTIIAAGWRNFAVYRTELDRDVNTVTARNAGGKPTCIVGDRLSYWTGTEWRWAE